MADNFFDIPLPPEQQDAAVNKIKNFFVEKKNSGFDLINRRFSGNGVEGRWIHATKVIRVYIDKKPWYVPQSKIEKAIREFIS